MQADKKQILTRLATIEGHLRGIRKMVDEDQYCVDILKQSYAVERALQKFEAVLLEGHLASCVPTAVLLRKGATAKSFASSASSSSCPENEHVRADRSA